MSCGSGPASDVNTEPVPLGSGMNSALGVYVIAGPCGFPRNTIQSMPFIIPAVPQEKMSTHFCERELKQMFNGINNSRASAPAEMFHSEPPLRTNRRPSRTLASRNGQPGSLSLPAVCRSGDLGSSQPSAPEGSALEGTRGKNLGDSHTCGQESSSEPLPLHPPQRPSIRTKHHARPTSLTNPIQRIRTPETCVSQTQGPINDHVHLRDPRAQLGTLQTRTRRLQIPESLRWKTQGKAISQPSPSAFCPPSGKSSLQHQKKERKRRRGPSRQSS